MLNIILPTTPLTTFGEELGVKSVEMNWDMKSNQTKADGEGRMTHYGVYSKLTRDLRHQQTILFGALNVADKNDTLVVQGWKFMSCSQSQELCQQASWILIGCTRVVNNQSEVISSAS